MHFTQATTLKSTAFIPGDYAICNLLVVYLSIYAFKSSGLDCGPIRRIKIAS